MPEAARICNKPELINDFLMFSGGETASSPNNTKSRGFHTPAFCERRFFNVPATFPLPSTPYGIYSIPHAMQFVNTTVYCISQNAKSRGSHPRLFASKGNHSSHAVYAAPNTAYIVYHTPFDLSIPLYVVFFILLRAILPWPFGGSAQPSARPQPPGSSPPFRQSPISPPPSAPTAARSSAHAPG